MRCFILGGFEQPGCQKGNKRGEACRREKMTYPVADCLSLRQRRGNSNVECPMTKESRAGALSKGIRERGRGRGGNCQNRRPPRRLRTLDFGLWTLDLRDQRAGAILCGACRWR